MIEFLGLITRLDAGVITIYAAMMVLVGIVFMRHTKSAKDLFAAGGNAPWWAAGISSYMTFFSASTFVIWGSIAYMFGWVAITIQWVIVVATVIVTFFFAHRWKRIGIESPIQFLEERYSLGVKQLYVWIRLLFSIQMAAQAIYGVAVLTHSQVSEKYSLNTVIIALAAIVVLYTVLGGLWAILATDVLQFFMLTLITILAFPLSLKAVGGIESFIHKAPNNFFQFAQNAKDFADSMQVKFTWSYFFWWTIFQIFFIGTMWEFIQKFQSCSSEKNARKCGYLVAGLYIFMPVFWLIPLMIFRIIDPSYYNPSEPLLTKQAEAVYMIMIKKLLPVGLTGLALAAMISATGSTTSAVLNVMSTVLTRDFYGRLIKKDASEKELAIIGRCFIFILGIVVAFIASKIRSWGGIVEYWFVIVPILIGPLSVPFLWGVISKRAGACSVWVAVWTGILCSSIIQFVLPLYGIQATLAIKILASTLIPLIIMIVGSKWMKPESKKQKQIDAFFEKIVLPTGQPCRGTIDYRPLQSIGILVAIFGAILMQLLWFVKVQRVFILCFCIFMIISGVYFYFSGKLQKQKGKKCSSIPSK